MISLVGHLVRAGSADFWSLVVAHQMLSGLGGRPVGPLCSTRSLILQWASSGLFTWQQCSKRARMAVARPLETGVLNSHFCLILLVRAVTGLPRFKGWRRKRFYLLLGGVAKNIWSLLSVDHSCGPWEYTLVYFAVFGNWHIGRLNIFFNEWLN